MASYGNLEVGSGPGSERNWSAVTGDEASFVRASHVEIDVEDEEELMYAALERLPTYNRFRSAILSHESEDGKRLRKHVDLRHLKAHERRLIVERALSTQEQDNEILLQRLRSRIDRVGLKLPTVEVRFKNLSIKANVFVGNRALPTILNFTRNVFERVLNLVNLKPNNKAPFTILQDVSGIINPSRFTLLLGPPGSGKSSLLLSLAGKLNKNLKVNGEITYNGYNLSEFIPQRTSAYISQTDRHIATMTVRETLDFSVRCQGTGHRFDLLREIEKREKELGIKPDLEIDAFMKAAALEGHRSSIMTEYIMKILGLDICADTVIGSEMLRGISGGQKKRVTTGEMIVGPKKTLFMDEISTGLDSSTTFQIVKCVKNFCHLFEATVLMALLQPAPETFELFDDVLLLSEGLVVYHGPRLSILPFFENMGFKCPERKGVADFLQEVTSIKDQEQYWTGNGPYEYVPVKNFSQAFYQSGIGKSTLEQLEIPFPKSDSHPAALVTEKYALSPLSLLRSCLSREWLLMKRDRFLYIFKTVQVCIVAFITMTLFFRTTLHPNSLADANIYLGALFYSMVHMMFNAFAEMSIIVSRLTVFYKQRDDFFYPAWAFAIPTYILRLPYSILESVIWTSLIYYVVGFAPQAYRFFGFMLIMFSVHQMAIGVFRFLGAFGRTMVIANTVGSFTLLVFFLLGGFILNRTDIHPWWIWGFWLSPLTYGQNALGVNEFKASRWQDQFVNTSNGIEKTLGDYVLESRGMFTQSWWYWIGVSALICFSLLFNFLVIYALKFFNPFTSSQVTLSKDTLEDKSKIRTGKVTLDSRKNAKRKDIDGYMNTTKKSSRFSFNPLKVILKALKHNSNGNSSYPNDGVIERKMKEKVDGKSVENQELKGKTENKISLPFTPLSLTFRNVNYFVDMPQEMKFQGETGKLQLLNNASGVFRPGVLTALLGISGAGKTTLMDVLAGRKTGGQLEGSISIGGYHKVQSTFARVTGYCEQTDVHSPQTTVYEALCFSAWLRLPSEVDKRQRQAFVEDVMELVEIKCLRNNIVGLPGISGLSTEQRKRLTFAVELVSNPSIIFLDEPTSGLDARAAAIVMRAVKNAVNTGRTVVCTIHQPSIDIFESFDELLLMKRGGQIIYQGPLGEQSKYLIDYFQSIHGVPKIKDRYNPATWVLEITSPSMESKLGIDFAEVFHSSALYKEREALISQLDIPKPGIQPLSFPTPYPQSPFVQFLACLWKMNRVYWKTPQYKAVNFYFALICALIFGTIFWGMGSKRSTLKDVLNVMGALYAAVLFLGVNNASTIQPVVAVERTVYLRERAAGMYSPLVYALSQGVVEIPYILFQTLTYSLITYSMIQFEWTAPKFLWYTFFMFVTFMYFTFYGMMTVAITPNLNLASVTSTVFYSIWNLFSGFLIPRPRIPP